MQWKQVDGRWDQLVGQIKAQWGKLTGEDLDAIAGKRQQLVAKLQERYGALKGDVERQVNEWLGKVESHIEVIEVPAASTEPAPQRTRALHRPNLLEPARAIKMEYQTSS